MRRSTLGAGWLILAAIAGTSPAYAQRTQELAALAVDSPSLTCLGKTTLAPSVRIVACTAAIESNALSGKDLASAFLARAQGYKAVGDGDRAKVDYAAAISVFDGLTDPSKLDGQYYLQRGIAHQALGDASKAISDYAAAIQQQPDEPRAWANRGILLAAKQPQLREALASFNRALELVPNSVDVLLLRADTFLALSEIGPAKADTQRAAELAPDNPRAVLMRGLVLARLGDFDRAFADYSEAIRLAPDYADALANRGAVLSFRGDYDNALRDLDAALKVAPRHATAAYNRGYARFAKRQYSEAMSDYTLAIQADPHMAWAFANRGLTGAIAGRGLKQALGDVDEALRLQPQTREFRETRGFILLKAANFAAAAGEYEAALRGDSNRPLALFGRGIARLGMGDQKQGQSDLMAARALMPTVDREFTSFGITVAAK